MHIRKAPDFFGTTTIPAHHGVGSYTREMMPIASILFSSSMSWCVGRMLFGIWFELNIVLFPVPERPVEIAL